MRNPVAKIARAQYRLWLSGKARPKELAGVPAAKLPEKINSGWCGWFAEELRQRLIEAKHHSAHTAETADFARTKSVWHSHAWVTCEGKHYDAEALEGVDDWQDLPFFRRRPELRRRRSRETDARRLRLGELLVAFGQGVIHGMQRERERAAAERKRGAS